MGRKLVDMIELEYGVVSTVVATAVVRKQGQQELRGEGTSLLTMGFCCFTSLLQYGFLLKVFIYLTVNFSRWHGSTYTTVLSSKARKLILSSGSVRY